jgi:hypothetical protein
VLKEVRMLIAVEFPGSLKRYTYSAPDSVKFGIHWFDGKLVVVLFEVKKKSDFEIKEFNGIYVQDELMRRHIERAKADLDVGYYQSLEQQSKYLNMLHTGMLQKYINAVHPAFLDDYIEWLL